MKTVQDLYGEIVASDGLEEDIRRGEKEDKLQDFLKAHGCEATEEEVKEYIETKAAEDTPIELSEDELKNVAGGTMVTDTFTSADETCGCSGTCIRDCC